MPLHCSSKAEAKWDAFNLFCRFYLALSLRPCKIVIKPMIFLDLQYFENYRRHVPVAGVNNFLFLCLDTNPHAFEALDQWL